MRGRRAVMVPDGSRLTRRPFRPHAPNTRHLDFGPPRADRPRIPRWVLRLEVDEERASGAGCCGRGLGFEHGEARAEGEEGA